jgi:hypothetical protein
MLAAWRWPFRLSSGQVVVGLSIDVDCELIELIDLLGDYYFGDLAAGNEPVSQLENALAAGLAADGSSEVASCRNGLAVCAVLAEARSFHP